LNGHLLQEIFSVFYARAISIRYLPVACWLFLQLHSLVIRMLMPVASSIIIVTARMAGFIDLYRMQVN
jgi:hypothetical protein